jgi:hypothetical protein
MLILGMTEGGDAAVIVTETVEITKVRSQTRPPENLVERFRFGDPLGRSFSCLYDVLEMNAYCYSYWFDDTYATRW